MSGLRIERSGRDGAVARVTLARPDVRNALDAGLIGGLRAAFEGFAAEPPEALRAVVLAGDGPAFCAGGDRAWMLAGAAATPEENEADARGLAAMYEAIDACPVPVVARVQGAALGGGAGLCAVADVVVAEAGAVLGFPEVRIGLVGATVGPFVIRRLGEGATRDLFLTGRRVDAQEALRLGLVHRVVADAGALDEAVAAVVAEVLAGGPEAVRGAKRLVRDLRSLPAADAARHTAALLADRRASAEGQEGLRAAGERRRPAWDEAP